MLRIKYFKKFDEKERLGSKQRFHKYLYLDFGFPAFDINQIKIIDID